jgi:hypothetical protein
LHVARTLGETRIDFSEVLQLSRNILAEALSKSDVELIQFLLEGGVKVTSFTGMLHYAETVETARLLLREGHYTTQSHPGAS